MAYRTYRVPLHRRMAFFPHQKLDDQCGAMRPQTIFVPKYTALGFHHSILSTSNMTWPGSTMIRGVSKKVIIVSPVRSQFYQSLDCRQMQGPNL